MLVAATSPSIRQQCLEWIKTFLLGVDVPQLWTPSEPVLALTGQVLDASGVVGVPSRAAKTLLGAVSRRPIIFPP